MNANPIFPTCDFDPATPSGEFQADDACPWGCTHEVVPSQCPPGMESHGGYSMCDDTTSAGCSTEEPCVSWDEPFAACTSGTWTFQAECLSMVLRPAPGTEPEAEPFTMDDLVPTGADTPLPGCFSEDYMYYTDVLFGKTGCDDECVGGAYAVLEPAQDAQPARCTGEDMETDATFPTGQTWDGSMEGCYGNAQEVSFYHPEVAAVEAFGICAFCAPVTYCDDLCFEAMCMDGEDCSVYESQCCWMDSSSTPITAADVTGIDLDGDGVSDTEFCAATGDFLDAGFDTMLASSDYSSNPCDPNPCIDGEVCETYTDVDGTAMYVCMP